MDAKTASLLITSVINLLLGIFVLYKDRKRRTYLHFAGITFGIFLWATSSIINHFTLNFNIALISTRISFYSAFIVTSSLLLFAIYFPEEKKHRLIDILLIFVSIVSFFICVFTNLLVEDVVLPGPNIVEKGIVGSFLSQFIILVLTPLILSLVILIKKYKKTTEKIVKIQIIYLFIGTLFSSFLTILFTLVFPFVLNIQFFAPFGSVTTIILTSFIAYSIVKYRFLDIRFTVRESLINSLIILIYTLTTFLFFFIFFAIFRRVDNKIILFISLISISFLILSYKKVSALIYSLFSQILFQKEHNREELIKTLGKTIYESIDLKNLLENLKDSLNQIINPYFVSFIIIEKAEKEIKYSSFFNKNNISLIDNLIRIFRIDNNRIIIKDELKILLRNTRMTDKEKEYLIRVYKEISQSEIQVIVPIPGHKEINGFILLGDKKFNEAYTINDISVLEMIQYHAGIAIENALFYNETKSFSQKLKKEVTKATTDLKDKNKFLTVLRRIDQIIMNTKEIKNMCQKIADTVSWEMGFAGGLIALVNEKKNVLQAVAISDTPTFHDFFKALPKDIDKLSISLTENHSLLIKSIKENKIIVANTFSEAYSPPLDSKVIAKLEAISEIKSHLICPISAKGKVLGLIVIGLGKKYEHLTPYENDLINTFLEEVGIALENLLLYEEIKRMNKYLVKANQELQELDKMKDEFVSVASHELRTPMTAIKGYAWMLEKGKHSLHLDERQKEYLSKITQSTERLISLVNDILNVSRIEGHKIQLNIQPAPIDELINNVISEIKPKAMEKNIILTYEKSQNTPLTLMDKDRVYEVVMNLVGNAIKFTPEAGKITVFTKNDGKMLDISVKDTGRGIAKNDIPKLFRKFGRLEHSFSLISENSGSGLGLYISRSLVELHGGKIWVTSKVGEGSTFSFSLRKA